ncbi:hypothetical protein NIIDMKKI_13980 [Mycobacterium kansasii]|uniref:Uncharacterized protein n=1 Tax=Mycobacterium kansasii TaxID=1768 RepID=A0A7G1I8Q9_MYCKA|nr:hypothetical protein NIIDMKKI_13980 [Mycobacterium kansasii]
MRQIGRDGVGGFLERSETIKVGAHEIPDAGAALLLVPGYHVDQHQSRHPFGAGGIGDQDAGQPAHAGPDYHHVTTDRIHDLQHVLGEGLDGVIRGRRSIAVPMSTGVERDDVKPLVRQDLPGLLPGEPVLAAAVQHQDARPIGRLGAAVPFVGDQRDFPTPENSTVRGLLTVLTHSDVT